MQDATSLPQDVQGCHALIGDLSTRLSNKEALLVEQARAIVELQAAREKQAQDLAELNLTIQKLLAGRRSERYVEDANQKQLDFGEDPEVQDGLADAADNAEEILDEYTVRRRRQSRKPRDEKLPEHLERYEVAAQTSPAEEQCAEHGPRQIVGYDTTETLEFQRPKLRVRVTRYPKYACAGHAECGLKQPPREPGLVEGNRFGTCVAAEIITAKCAYYLPVYRQQDWFAGSGWMPGRSTLLNIQANAAYVLEPLYRHYVEQVLAAPVVPTDDTHVMLLLPAEIPEARAGDARSQRIREVLSAARAADKKHVSARMWVYRSLESGGANVFDFTVSWHRDGPQDFLQNYTGTLMGDCYSGFDSIALASESRIVRAACHAHARRKIHEALEYHPRQASQLLAIYRRLYDIDDQTRGQSAEQVLAMRQAQSVPVMHELRTWLDQAEASQSVLPKSRLGAALRYLNNQWEALSVFLSDGRVPIDNNETEQLMKQVATGRKNWLFIGSIEAGRRAAILLTIVSTAHRYHLDIWRYVKDVLDRLLAGERDLAALRADRWAAAHPDALRPYRAEEARYRADAKAIRRAHRRQAEKQRSAKK